MIINKRITEAIRVLKQFPRSGQNYWLKAYKGLNNSEKGFIYLWLGLGKIL